MACDSHQVAYLPLRGSGPDRDRPSDMGLCVSRGQQNSASSGHYHRDTTATGNPCNG